MLTEEQVSSPFGGSHWLGWVASSYANPKGEVSTDVEPGPCSLLLSDEELRLIEAFRRFRAVMLANHATFQWTTYV